MDDKKTWVIDDRTGEKPLPTYPVLKVKRRGDGTIERFKAHIVGGGNLQTYRENDTETYETVVSFYVVRIFLYLVLGLNLSIAQLDVKQHL